MVGMPGTSMARPPAHVVAPHSVCVMYTENSGSASSLSLPVPAVPVPVLLPLVPPAATVWFCVRSIT